MMDVHAGFKQDRSRQQAGYEAEGRVGAGSRQCAVDIAKTLAFIRVIDHHCQDLVLKFRTINNATTLTTIPKNNLVTCNFGKNYKNQLTILK